MKTCSVWTPSFSPAIKVGQPVLHIYAANAAEIPCSQRAIYEYVKKNVLSIVNLELPRLVKYKLRRKKAVQKREPAWIEGHRYADFLSETAGDDLSGIVELDTVCGIQGDHEALLTIYFRQTHFMFIRLLSSRHRTKWCGSWIGWKTLLGGNPKFCVNLRCGVE